MADETKIEWCDSTFNPWIGCTRVSQACDDCYAARSTPARTLGIEWGPHAERHRTAPATWKQPVAWERQHAAFFAEHGRRRRVFCASLADVFDNAVPPAWRLDLLRLIRDTPNLDWLLLTKRVGNVRAMLSEAQRGAWLEDDHDTASWLGRWLEGQPPANVWLGATVANQEEADRDIGKLLCTPARVHFLSLEPLLGPVLVPEVFMRPLMLDGKPRSFPDDAGMVDWVIVGGESGPHARPMHPDWARSVRDQCAAAGVPLLFKQHGEWVSVSEVEGPGEHFTFPDGATVRRAGKALAGRTLDGRIHSEFPEVTP